MVSINQMLKAIQKDDTSSRINNVYKPFNSMVKAVNRPKWQVDDWSNLKFKTALALYQANHYCTVYAHLGITDDRFNDPYDVIDECQRRGIIWGEFSFPEKMNRKPQSGMGAMWEFSDAQLAHIKDDQGFSWNDKTQIVRPMRMDGMAGGVRSGKTASSLFKLADKACKPMLNGDRAIIAGYNFSSINRIATSETGNGSILEILPHAQLVKTDSESQKLVVPSLVFPFTQTTEIWLVGINSKKAMGNILGTSFDWCYLMEISQLLNYEQVVLEILNRSVASRFRYVLWDTNPFDNPAINRIVALFSGEGEVQKSQGYYRYSHWSILDGTNPSLPLGSTLLNEIVASYATNEYLFKTKILGQWVKAEGSVLTSFSREKNVIASFDQLGSIRIDALELEVDEGYGDASVVSCWMTYWSNDRKRFESCLIAEGYHQVGRLSNIPNVDSAPIQPSTFSKVVLDLGQMAYRKVKALSNKPFINFEIYVDPSAKGLRNQIEHTAQKNQLAYPDIWNRSYPSLGDNGNKLTRQIGDPQESAEEQFRMLNYHFDTGLFRILESDMFGYLPDGSFAYSTAQNIHECETFVRVKNRIPMAGEGHGDSIQMNRMFSNQFASQYDHMYDSLDDDDATPSVGFSTLGERPTPASYEKYVRDQYV